MAPLGLLLHQADAANVLGKAEQALVNIGDRTIFIALNTDGFSAANIDEVFVLNQLWAIVTAQWFVVGVDDALERGGRRSSGFLLHGRQRGRSNNSHCRCRIVATAIKSEYQGAIRLTTTLAS